MGVRRAGWLAALPSAGVRALVGYFGAEAVQVTASRPDDRRFAGKGIAVRNALLIGGFSLLLPALHRSSTRRDAFPWTADAVLLSIPALDMAGNSLDLYNRNGAFDSFAHFYGTAAAAALLALAMEGRAKEPVLVRWLVAAGGTTFLHVLLEIQEYWTDVLFGTHNVEGIEDAEGDVLWGICGVVAGTALIGLGLRSKYRAAILEEAQRLADCIDPVFRT